MKALRSLQILPSQGVSQRRQAQAMMCFRLRNETVKRLAHKPTPPTWTQQAMTRKGRQPPTKIVVTASFTPGTRSGQAPYTKVVPEHSAGSERHFYEPPPRKAAQCFGVVAIGCDRSIIANDTRIANAFENSYGQVRWGGRARRPH
jgi:hypothetical protein